MKELPRIIGICGKKYSGKDTIADILVTEYGYEKISFATPLKKACALIFGFTDNQLNGSEKEMIDPFWKITPREVLQFVGTELFRKQVGVIIPHVGEDIWVISLLKIINDNPNKKYVIADIRFPNEISCIKSNLNSVAIWRVTRPTENNNNFSNHASEIDIDKLPIDKIIINDKTINDLRQKIIELNI